MNTEKLIIDEKDFDQDPPTRRRRCGLRRILTDSCLIATTVVVTLVGGAIIAYVTLNYYQLCATSDAFNRTECAQ